MKELNVKVPKGYKIDTEKSTFEEIIFKRKERIPESWDEFLEKNPKVKSEYFIASDSSIQKATFSFGRNNEDQNLCKTREEADAFLAFIKLKRLWHEYVDDYTNQEFWCHIYPQDIDFNDGWVIGGNRGEYCVFSFPSDDMAIEFLNNFKDLFNEIKPLYYGCIRN